METRTRAALGAVAALLLLAGCTSSVRGTPGAAGLRDPYFPKLGNGGYDVRHYALTLAYDPADGRLDATAEITARATQDLSAFNLDLTGLTVSGATVDGAPAAVNRAGSELTLRPRTDIDKGQEFRTTVTYSGVPEKITDSDGAGEGWLRTEDGALALGEPAGSLAWFPGNHHPSDKATYDITVTVPQGLRAFSNGERRSERTANGRTTAVWRSAEPMASYLAMVAIGRYETKSVPATGAAGIPVLSAADPSVAAKSAPLLDRIPELLEWSRENFGPYPFSSAGAIVEPTGDVGYALETQTRPVLPQNAFDVETLVHELAHQWYGNSVTPATWRDMWLNEGFATYAEWLYAEDFEDTPAQESFEEAFATEVNWAFPPAEPPTERNLFDPPVYERGAMVLHKIRQRTGDDTFYEILAGWPATHRHGNASTDDFIAYVEDVAGEDLDEVWDVWLYGDEKPERPN
ncbi:M1 family metallopeptidase [Streptomyces vilmorinianum]|uniref:M1 family metallopeptidase n=1 Tax=Streptomyces vilmorinianum TaxID=3051092 RepID=UPI0010FB68B3|nr:M1 family metallopeptidase [Streptomyces vilmorinianum]